MAKIRKTWKKQAAIFLAGVLAAGTLLAGCQEKEAKLQKETGAQENTAEETVMGRYLEEELPLPDGVNQLLAVTELEDGAIRCAFLDESWNPRVFDSTTEGESWEERVDIPKLLGMDEYSQGSRAALSRHGEIFASITKVDPEDDSNYQYVQYYIDSQQQVKELVLENITSNSQSVWQGKFADNGNLYLQVSGCGIQAISREDQSVTKVLEQGKSTTCIGIVGSRLLAVVDGTIHYYDQTNGDPLPDETALTEQITAKEENLYITTSQGFPILFLEDSQKDQLFYVNREGMYCYQPGGSIVEQIFDGNLTSLKAPDVQFVDGVYRKDGSFLLGVATSDGGKLLNYVYSPDTPSRPEIELKVYSMMENDMLAKAATMFQSENPNIMVNVEIGYTGEDGVTSADAQKNLNTEIMAGKGPDILLMDGFSTRSYVEKGLLADVSGLLKDMGLLENIRQAYTQEDGAVYLMPVQFGIPLVVGRSQDISGITDLVSLADVACQLYENEEPLNSGFYFGPYYYGFSASYLSYNLASFCSPAWTREDGTVNEEAVREFIQQAGRIYGTCNHDYEEEFQMQIEEYLSYLGLYPMQLYSQSSQFMGDILTGPMQYASLYTLLDMLEGYDYGLLNGQVQNCFFPINTVAISSKSENQEAAKQFYQYLFSEKLQRAVKDQGLSVLEKVFMDTQYWGYGTKDYESISGGTSNNETGEYYEYTYIQPDEAQIGRIQEIGKSLTVAAPMQQMVLDAMTSQVERYTHGEITLDEAVNEFMKNMNLYLSE